jgi:hypothetical protein
MERYLKLVFVILLTVFLTGCEPSGSSRGFSFIWYVALSGDNSNACSEPGLPCLTVEGALQKARDTNTRVASEYPDETVSIFHTINVAAGTYMIGDLRDGQPFARVDLNATIIGAGESMTIFDSSNLYGGIYINGEVQVELRELAIRNVFGTSPDSCINIRGAAAVTIENVTVHHCERSGINHLSTGLLELNNVTVTGSLLNVGGNGTGVSSQGTVVVNGGSFSANQGWGISSAGELTATGLRVEGNGREGVVISGGSAELTNLVVVDNGTDRSFRAGLSIFNDADVTLRSSQIDNNQYGIWQHAGTLRVIESTINGNPRTAILLDAGELRLTEATIQGNGSFYTGTGLPGALAIEEGARAILRNSRVLGNLNGGIVNGGELFFLDSALLDHSGGMPALFTEVAGTAIVERSLIASNRGGENMITGGVAIDNRGEMIIVNSTISGNTSAIGVTNSGLFSLAYSTIAFNTGTGFVSSESSTDSPWLANNLIAGNGTDCYTPRSAGAAGTLTLAGFNADTDGSCGFRETYSLDELNLDELADNGGPTETHALLAGSPVIDAASGSCPTNDQRTRARPFGPGCDPGSYETGSTIVRLSAEIEDLDFTTETPDPMQPNLIVVVETGCFFGPGEAWLRVSTLAADTQALIVGQGFGGGWMVVKHPTANTNCWIDIDDVEFDIPLDQLRLIAIPPKPTVTPSATTGPREPTPCPTNPQIPGTCQ